MRSLGVLTTIPARAHVLDQVVRSVKSQLDELVVHEDHPLGAWGKLSHAYRPDTMYFLLDDDLVYPSNYVAVMRYWMDFWRRGALIAVHGRVMPPRARLWGDADFKTEVDAFGECGGCWVNWPGACGLAFHTDTMGMTEDQCANGFRNNEETWLAIWAQQRRLPVWVVPHPAGWLTDLKPGGPTIYRDHEALKMEPRNELLRQFTAPWQVYTGRRV
jgi:hypothetical protein